jgi:hypothetical protein
MMKPMAQPFSTLAVAGAYSGYVLEHEGIHGMNGITDVMYHLFPDIMMLGAAAIQPYAAKELARQIPALAELGGVEGGDWEAYAAKVVERLGATVDVIGPMAIGEPEIDAAFERFAKGGD